MPSTNILEKPELSLVASLRRQTKSQTGIVIALYLLGLSLLSAHLYFTPIYDMDSIQYMGNALLMEETDIVHLHARVYAELRRAVPNPALEHLLGNDTTPPDEQSLSRRERATNAYRYAEFLPLFAIRPSYNQVLYLVSKTGIGLVRSGILISVASYYLLGVLVFLWLRRHTGALRAALLCFLTMLSPPLLSIGRDTTSDALASLVAFSSLFMIFEQGRVTFGFILLLASIYFRTDFVVLAGPVILVCWLQRRFPLWQGAILAVVAVSSVLCINHFAGDYGIKMLYYRNFVGTPIAPAEMTVHFSAHDYVSAFRSGITKVIESFFVPFLLVGSLQLWSKKAQILLGVTLSYVLLHFVILPNWQERWVAVFYLATIVCATTPKRDTNDSVSGPLTLQQV